MSQVRFKVNGVQREVDADADMPLLWVLRDILGLTATKYGCGAGICGACTVLDGGEAVRSCQIPLSSTDGHAYTTLEGLSADGSHPLQRAWLDEQVSQCGYCQSGMILEIRALLAKNPSPQDADIDDALVDHVCRCGSFPRIRKAVKLAAKNGGGR